MAYYEDQIRQNMGPRGTDLDHIERVALSQALSNAPAGRHEILHSDQEPSNQEGDLNADRSDPNTPMAFQADLSVTSRQHEEFAPVRNQNMPFSPWEVSETHAAHNNSHVTTDPETIVQQPSSPQPSSEGEETLDADTSANDISSRLPEEIQPSSPPLSLKQSLGIIGCITIFGGQLVLLGVIAFLSFLWFGHGSAPEGVNATVTWRQIATRGYMTQSITLSALVLRFIVSAQAAVCTSMIAAMLLERRKRPQPPVIRRSQAAWFSVMRGLNDGPRKLIQMLLSSALSRSTGSAKILRILEFWMILLVALTSLGLQFSSTILISDLRRAPVVGAVNTTSVGNLLFYDNEDSVTFVEDATWADRSPVYAVYGEAPQPDNATAAVDAHGRSDTGVIQRGFLPFVGSENRTSVRSFEGNAMVLSSRVMCIKPNIANMRVSDTAFGGLLGTLYYRSSLRAAALDDSACDSDNCRDRAFACFFPTQGTLDGAPDDFNRWQASICLLTGEYITDHSLSAVSRWEPGDDLWARNSTAWLVISTNMDAGDDYSELDNQRRLQFNTEDDATTEWVSYTAASGRSLNITLCFSGYYLERRSVKMATLGILREPKIDWSFVDINYTTTEAQRYITPEVGGRDNVARGLLDLEILGDVDDGGPNSPASNMTDFGDEGALRNATLGELTVWLMSSALYDAINVGSNKTFRACYNCIFQGLSAHPEVGMLFSDLVSTTKHAAVALQGFMSILSTTIFETYMSSLSRLEDVKLAQSVEVLFPGQCNGSRGACAGFISVVVLLGVNIVCTAAIVVLYARRARYSRYGDVWHTVSQLFAQELRDFIDSSNVESDERVIADKKENDGFITLGLVEDGTRVEVIPYVGDEKKLG